MANISSEIARVILDMLEQTGHAEIQRNGFAQQLGCAPSQINYVLASRFAPEMGFIVESRRGGGGYIRIRRVSCERGAVLPALVNAIGPRLDESTMRAHIANLHSQDLISAQAAQLMLAAAGDAALRAIERGAGRDTVRASVFKQCLLAAC